MVRMFSKSTYVYMCMFVFYSVRSILDIDEYSRDLLRCFLYRRIQYIG